MEKVRVNGLHVERFLIIFHVPVMTGTLLDFKDYMIEKTPTCSWV
jgi:hypothetical protein